MVLAMKKMKIALMKSAKKPTKVKKGTLKETHVVTNIRFAQQCSLSPSPRNDPSPPHPPV